MYASKQITQLAVLTKHGFEAADITSVLAHSGGSKNIAALQGLLECIPGKQITQLTVLTKHG